MRRKILVIMMTVCMILSMIGCGSASDVTDQVANVVDSLDEHVLAVKNGHPSAYSNKTYGEAFDDFFGSPTWKYFSGTQDGPDDDGDGEPDYTYEDVDVVEFTGYCTYQDVEVKALLQFVLSKEDDTFEATYLSFNDVPQSTLIMYALLDNVFSDDDSSSDSSSDSENADMLSNDELSSDDSSDSEGLLEDMTSEGEETEDETDLYYDYYSIYGEILDEFALSYGEYNYYAVFDLDNDGVKELIVSYGESDADWANDVYAYSEAGAIYCGTFYLPVSLYGSDDGNGIYAVYEHMDTQIVSKIELENFEITEEEILDGGFPADNDITMLSVTDYSLLY